MHAREIAAKTYWVGKIDDRPVPFHRLILEKGTTYNSYLLNTEKPTIIDTVDILFGKEYVDKLSSQFDLEKIQYVVINHVEPDHAGALPALLAKAKNATVVATELGVALLKDMFNLSNRSFKVVRDGDRLDIGGKTLKFFETPWLHTEETMVTYAVEDKILYPCDQFSTHIATSELFNDLAEKDYLEDFQVYYDLIMGPHRPYVRAMLEKIKCLEINMIAPSHGYILRENPAKFIALYDQFSQLPEAKNSKKVTIAFATMTGNTRKIAQRLAEVLEQENISTTIFNLKNADLDQVLASIEESDGLLVGSSTRYGDMVAGLEPLLEKIAAANLKEIPAAVFGSFGWSGEATLYAEGYLRRAGLAVIDDNYLLGSKGYSTPLFPLRIKFLDEKGLETAVTGGKIFAEIVLARPESLRGNQNDTI